MTTANYGNSADRVFWQPEEGLVIFLLFLLFSLGHGVVVGVLLAVPVVLAVPVLLNVRVPLAVQVVVLFLVVIK
ncbi:hypothetical protein EYF80_012959 [Liparis tanakae]|uniref:Uncharacterized protein n=1 Tax=Liparis tanakae TaxID=230148 RepID=A0A4Z2IFY9_9TELE|nr:hypothetical protein EYF80_012959 [Liparis tanakae]